MAALGLLLPAPASALFSAKELERVDTEPFLDYEYFSDLQAFSYPMEWDLAWRASTMSYRASGASLDCCDLLWSQELLTRFQLADTLAFSVRLAQQEDKERRDLHYLLEFEKKLPWGLTAWVFGEPTYDKKDADAGLGLGCALSKGLQLSYRRTAADFPFNRKAGDPQRYSRQPFTDEFRVDADFARGRLSLQVELDQPLRREFWNESRSYSYRRTTGRASYQGPVLGVTGRLGYTYEYQHEGDYLSPDPGTRSVDYRRRTHTLLAAVLADLGARDSLEAGHNLILRDARNDNPHDPDAGIMYRRWEAEPYARWRHRASDLVTTELAAFLSLGEYRKRYPAHLIPSVFDPIIQAKLGTGLDFTFGPRGRVGLYGAFDLDGAATHPWDGGSIRAMFVF